MKECYVCKSKKLKIIPVNITKPAKVNMCMECNILSTFPQMSEIEVEDFYNKSFDGDPGAKNITEEALKRIEQTTFVTAINELKKYVIPYIKPYLKDKNKKWLEIRYRTGALLKILDESGMDVYGVDPFENNKKTLINNYDKINIEKVKVENVYNMLKPFSSQKFDIISSISIHSLAHVPDPLKYLNEIYQMLNEDGIAIFDEKDIEYVSDNAKTLPLEHPNPLGHFHHLTIESARNLINMTDFEIEYMEYYERKSDLRHFIIILRKHKERNRSTRLYKKLLRMHGVK